jgi:hypothetical protein
MTWGATAIAGASIVGGVMGSDAAKKASDAQAQSAREALALQKQMYDQTVARNQPWLNTGMGANNKLATLLGTGGNAGDAGYGSMTNNFSMADYLNNQDPGYQFGINTGINTLNAQNAATGGLNSGASMKAAQRYGVDYAGTKYNEAFNRYMNNRSNVYNMLSGQSAVGQNSANNTGAAGANYANAGGADITGAGNAAASGYIGSANAYNNAIGGITNAYNQYNANQMYNNRTAAMGGGSMPSGGGTAGDPYGALNYPSYPSKP